MQVGSQDRSRQRAPSQAEPAGATQRRGLDVDAIATAIAAAISSVLPVAAACLCWS